MSPRIPMICNKPTHYLTNVIYLRKLAEKCNSDVKTHLNRTSTSWNVSESATSRIWQTMEIVFIMAHTTLLNVRLALKCSKTLKTSNTFFRRGSSTYALLDRIRMCIHANFVKNLGDKLIKTDVWAPAASIAQRLQSAFQVIRPVVAI